MFNTIGQNRALRQSQAAAAVICARREGSLQWLVRWNNKWRCYHLVGGHREAGESFRDCLIREVKEELSLCEGDDFFVGKEPLAHLEYEAWSESHGEQTLYIVELFAVKIADLDGLLRAGQREDIRWATRSRIEDGRFADGLPIAAATNRWLAHIHWTNPSETDVDFAD